MARYVFWLFVFGGLLFAQNPCDDPSTRTALCQPVGTPTPNPHEVGPPIQIGPVEAVLEDGGKPAARPDYVYHTSCNHPLALASPGYCHVRIFLKGFRETVVTPNSRTKTIAVLQRVGAEGDAFPKNMVNVATLSMPPAAHKAYAKGEVAMGLRNLPEAEKWFQLAVKEFPGHALAWDELGLALEGLGKPQEARTAYERAAEADPRFARPFVHLAGMAILEKLWDEAATLSARALALQPSNFPRAYFYDALANFNLKRFPRAAQSAEETIRLDSSHAFPIAEYLLGDILAGRGDSAGAAEHLNRYLKLAPQDRFAGAARQRLAELSGTAAR